MACAAEVVVRFADTTMTTAYVSPGGSFVLGRTRDADAAVDVAMFTLLESTPHGFVVRAARDAQPVALEDAPIELAFGWMTIRVSLVAHERTPVARRRIERRPFAYGGGSLFVHSALLLGATWLAAPDDTAIPAVEHSRRRPARIARFAVSAQTVKRENKPPPAVTPVTTDDTPSTNPATDELVAATAASIESVPSPNGRGEKIATTPEAHESAGNDETGRRFDPDANPAFDTVKIGSYTTVATGNQAGASFKLAGENGQRKPLIVVSCDSSSCVIVGGDPASGVREALEARLDDIVACYEQHAQTAGKKVELDFGIDDSGKVDAVNIGGVGDYDSCVADIIKNLDVAAK